MFTVIQSNLKKQEKHRIDSLTLHLKQLEKEEQKNPQSQQKERNHKDQSRNNEKEMKETIAKINKTKTLFFWEEDKQNWQTTSQTHQEKEKDQINKIRNGK